jgi:hypothetical protein
MPQRITLDTSCGLNLLGVEAPTDPAVARLVNLGLSGRVQVSVTSAALEEVSNAPDPQVRRRRMATFEMFPVIQLTQTMQAEGDRLRDDLLSGLFPKSEPHSTTWLHNRQDCAHLAAHRIGHGDAFVTLDRELLKRARAASEQFTITIVPPSVALERVLLSLGKALTLPGDVAIRGYQPDDEAEVRQVLEPLADDYPDFDRWLTHELTSGEANITVGMVDDRVAAAAIWKRKDGLRVVKLAAFRVDESARQNGLGPHLLWYLIRQWVGLGTELAYATVSSTHAELVAFFNMAGFLVHGVTPDRYKRGVSEIVVGKHFLRRVVKDEDLTQLAEDLGDAYFGVPSADTGAHLAPARWLLPPRTTKPTVDVDHVHGAITLEDGNAGRRRILDAIDIETLFHPIRLSLSKRRPLLVPIQPVWANQMMRYSPKQLVLFEGSPANRLLLRLDNAYYCYPTCFEELETLPPILFYVSEPESSCVAEARVLEYTIDRPESLMERYGNLGVYNVEQVRHHARRGGPHDGLVLALRFGLYVPFPEPVSLVTLRSIRATRNAQPQVLTPIEVGTYERIRAAGGLNW